MKRTLVALAAFSLAGSLAGCAWYPSQSNVASAQFQYRPGSGVVESVAAAPRPFMAAAGGSAPDNLYRLKIRMDDGRMQYIDTSDGALAPGTRVRLTDGRLIERL